MRTVMFCLLVLGVSIAPGCLCNEVSTGLTDAGPSTDRPSHKERKEFPFRKREQLRVRDAEAE